MTSTNPRNLTVSWPKPTLHRPIPLGTRVRLPDTYVGPDVFGTVTGISTCHVVFFYIVTLDEAVHDARYDVGDVPGMISTVTVLGTELTAEDGSQPWGFAQGSEEHIEYLAEIGQVPPGDL